MWLLFKLPCLQPTFQCPDFEDAVLRAVTAVFGGHINHQGCFYHLPRASWRQIQQRVRLEELDAGIELCVWGFLHGAARLGHCRHTGTQPGQRSGWVFLWSSIKYSKTRNAMKDLATNTREKPSQIFAQVVSQCDDNVQALLPREENPKRTIRYQRPTPPVLYCSACYIFEWNPDGV
jgi:hypothetical protein